MTLDICGDKTVQGPTEADIRKAVALLDFQNGDGFLVLGPTQMTYIQTSGDQTVGFILEYQENDTNQHYKATREFTADEVAAALVSYCKGKDDWKRMASWELISW